MKRTIYGMTLFLLLFTACKRKEKDDPQATARAFFEALKKNDFEEAGKYATKNSQSSLEMLKSAIKMAEQFGQSDEMDFLKELKGKNVEFNEAQMDGADRARVTILADGKEYMPLILIKEENAWKVAFDKATIMDTERKNSEEEQPSPEVSDSL